QALLGPPFWLRPHLTCGVLAPLLLAVLCRHPVLPVPTCPTPGDLSGHLLAYLSLSPVFVIVGFVTLIIFKRELHTISFLGGLALNEGVNWLIKHVIQEPRPCGGRARAVGSGGSPVGTCQGGLHPPILLCSLSPRPPHGSGHQVRDALQPFPIYVVLLRLFLPFPVFKVRVCPGRGGPELAQAGHCQGLTLSSLDSLWTGAWPLSRVGGAADKEKVPRQHLDGTRGCLGGLGSRRWAEAV
uniref:Uncharacterized protein n=1 Tax=Ursus maritimus TaxID=29073 RepID=A0A452V3K0_URSMA